MLGFIIIAWCFENAYIIYLFQYVKGVEVHVQQC